MVVVDIWWIDPHRTPDVAAAVDSVVTRHAGASATPWFDRRPRGRRASTDGPWFSVAHTPRHSVCVVSAVAVGVDCEPVVPRPGLADMAADLGLCGRAAELHDIYRAWVCCEAAGKALGRGLDLAARDLPAAAMTGRHRIAGHDVTIVETTAPCGHVAAVAVLARGLVARHHPFDGFAEPPARVAARAPS